MFVHGESYEWNSGNPYDGSVLASYGQVWQNFLQFFKTSPFKHYFELISFNHVRPREVRYYKLHSVGWNLSFYFIKIVFSAPTGVDCDLLLFVGQNIFHII